MSFTQSIFIFLFFPLSIGGFYISHFAEKKIKLFEKLRISDFFLIGISFIFYYSYHNSATGKIAMLYIFLYILSIYIFGYLISKLREKNKKNSKIILILSICILLSMLFYAKYITFFFSVISSIIGAEWSVSAIFVPLGISFITFSGISYVVDVYRGDASKGSVLDVFLYMSLFTKIVSGPIILWKDFEPQIKNRYFGVDDFTYGINRIMIGFAKKLILADFFGLVVTNIYDQIPYGIDTPTAWIFAILYTLQIYYDFAGYSDIAIGVSALFGIRVKNNFNFPYTAKSITEFWQRWHISLGTWFREYLYIPLGGNRKGKRRTLINLAIVFLITGIWHGAGYNYIFWGILHGTFVLIERCLKDNKYYTNTPAILRWFITMFVVNIGWQTFRIQDTSLLLDLYQYMFCFKNANDIFLTWEYFLTSKVIFFAILGILGATLLNNKVFDQVKHKLDNNPVGFIVKELFLLLLMIVSIVYMVSSLYSPFIYFQY